MHDLYAIRFNGKILGVRKLLATTVFGKMPLLFISENYFFHKIKHDGMTSSMDFMCALLRLHEVGFMRKQAEVAVIGNLGGRLINLHPQDSLVEARITRKSLLNPD